MNRIGLPAAWVGVGTDRRWRASPSGTCHTVWQRRDPVRRVVPADRAPATVSPGLEQCCLAHPVVAVDAALELAQRGVEPLYVLVGQRGQLVEAAHAVALQRSLHLDRDAVHGAQLTLRWWGRPRPGRAPAGRVARRAPGPGRRAGRRRCPSVGIGDVVRAGDRRRRCAPLRAGGPGCRRRCRHRPPPARRAGRPPARVPAPGRCAAATAPRRWAGPPAVGWPTSPTAASRCRGRGRRRAAATARWRRRARPSALPPIDHGQPVGGGGVQQLVDRRPVG